MAKPKRSNKKVDHEPEIVNRKARHLYAIDDTLEVGIRLTGTEVKSVRAGRATLAEGYVRARSAPPRLELIGVNIAHYDNASAAFQHKPTRVRELLAHKREILKLAAAAEQKGVTIVPLKMYFKNNMIKLQLGVGRGKTRVDKREDIRERETRRDIERAMTKRM